MPPWRHGGLKILLRFLRLSKVAGISVGIDLGVFDSRFFGIICRAIATDKACAADKHANSRCLRRERPIFVNGYGL